MLINIFTYTRKSYPVYFQRKDAISNLAASNTYLKLPPANRLVKNRISQYRLDIKSNSIFLVGYNENRWFRASLVDMCENRKVPCKVNCDEAKKYLSLLRTFK